MRLRRRGLPKEARGGFAAGTAASFASTLASQELIRVVERDSALWPYAAYRAGLAGTVLANLWHRRRARHVYLNPDGVSAAQSGNGAAAGNGAPSWATGKADPEKRPG
jgi:hypothetical protein